MTEIRIGSGSRRSNYNEMSKDEKFRFRKLDTIGAAAAEDDASFLNDCYINTGAMETLRNCQDPRRIVVGRTGAGKSALLLQLSELEDRCIEVRPESLALSYISNSNILQFFAELGVQLDIFFRLLWRHVFTVEILKHHFNVENETASRNVIQRLLDAVTGDKNHKKAIEYLQQWGRSFWQETEYRIKEVTTTLEKSLKASAAGKIEESGFNVEGARSLTTEQKADLVNRAQSVVNAVQIRELSEILDLVKDVLIDEQKRYYIVLDRLDENWVEERLRYRLIRALIETVKDFARIQHAKIVPAIRLDLLERVFRLTRDSGFQEEKYESLYLPLDWSRAQLVSVLNSRVNRLIRSRYTSESVRFEDILPKRIDGQSAVDYIIERTMMRPRDAIVFLNYCIQRSADKPTLSVQVIKEAEGEYSRERLRSLADEWSSDFPNLMEIVPILNDMPKQFIASDLTDPECQERSLQLLVSGNEKRDEIWVLCEKLVSQEIRLTDFKREILYVMYRIGIVGLRVGESERYVWAINGKRSITRGELLIQCKVKVHPMFWRVLHLRNS